MDLRPALLLAAASILVIGPARAQTPDEVMCSQVYPDAAGRAACDKCGADFEKKNRACGCAIAPKYCQGQEPATGAKLGVTLRFAGAPVQNAKITVARGAGTTQRTSDADGSAIFDVGPGKVTVRDVTLGPDTSVKSGVFPKPLAPWTVKLDRDVTIEPSDTNKKLVVALPTATVFVSALYHDEATDAWKPTRARAIFFLGDQKLVAVETNLQKTSFELLVPPDKVGRDLRVQAIDLDHKTAQDSTSLRIPAAGKSAFLTLHLGDLLTQLERARAKLRAMLEQAYGPDVAREVTAGVRFEIGDFPTASYNAGVMRVPSNWSLTSADVAETIFHEWGHRVQAVLASDATFDATVGGRTASAWQAAPSPAIAWDEARANFYSQLFTASLKYPGDKAYREPTAKAHGGGCATCPGYLASALVTHYRDAGLYGNALEIARDVRAVHDEASRVLGHPPRSYQEFVRAKTSLVDRQIKEGALTAAKGAAVKKQLADVNARFKL